MKIGFAARWESAAENKSVNPFFIQRCPFFFCCMYAIVWSPVVFFVFTRISLCFIQLRLEVNAKMLNKV